MRKYQQAKIMDLLQTLSEALIELRKQSKKDIIIRLLADCQEFTIQVGRYIEEIEGKGTETVALLEKYCELLFKAANEEIVEKVLRKHLAKIFNSVRSELAPNKMEMVFLSYKASMSDSILSIYQAAKDDPSCDTYWMPIPYFERNADSSSGKMCYEGQEYYPNIECTDWRDYDIEAHHPDAIFTFNPYDGNNYVTSVHPDFYCERLCKLTDLLVYAPYYVTAENDQDSFVTTAGCIYAHKVIVQSEKIRKMYVRIFKENFGNKFGKPEEKFIALGSPKLDAVLNTRREDYELPEEWRKLIGDKKVILYNTSIGAMLKGNEKYLDKLRNVFDVVRKRNDVILWWRPHPLSRATYESMRPHLLDEYDRLVDEYMVGILDQSPDLHRALAFSDAYFGDGASSLVTLYKATGKPIMLQNMACVDNGDEALKDELLHSDVICFGNQVLSIEELKQKYPQYYTCWEPYRGNAMDKFVIVPDYEYGTSFFLNAIYRLDEEHGKAEYFRSFPDEKNLSWRYNTPVRLNNKLIFAPAHARKWAFYDIESNLWTYDDLPKELHPNTESGNAFGSKLIYKNEIIFIPNESCAFAKYDIETAKITYHKELYRKLRKHITHPDSFLLRGISYYNDSFLFTLFHENIIFEINLQTMSLERTYQVGNGRFGFSAGVLIPHTDTIYLIKSREKGQKTWEETIVKWNIKTGEHKEIKDLPVKMIENDTMNAFGSFVYWKNILYILPLQGDTVLSLDTETDAIKRIELTPKFDFFERKSKYYTWAKNCALPYVIFGLERMKCIVQLPYDYGLADIDLGTGEITNRRKWRVEGIENLYKNQKKYNDHIIETVFFALTDFLEDLHSNENDKICTDTELTEGKGAAGQAIFNYVKKLTET